MFCFSNVGLVIINTLENCFFQIFSYSLAYVRIISEKTKGKIHVRPSMGKQNIQAKEVYRSSLPVQLTAVVDEETSYDQLQKY